MSSIFLDEKRNTRIEGLKHSLNLMTPESVNAIQNINTLNDVHRQLITRKKEINDLRNLDTIPSDITYIEMYSDAVGDKIILVENRIQELQNIDAVAEIGGKRRRRTRRTKRRRNKSSKTRRRNKGSKRRRR